MDVGRSFTYITEDEEWWKKVLIGGLLSLIPIVGPFYMMGYVLQVIQNVMAKQETPLPEVLEDFGGKLVKGLMLTIIVLIYVLPIIIISACAGAGGGVFPGIIDDPDTAGIAAIVWGSCFGCLSLLFGIAISLLMPFVWARYAETGQFGDAFQLGKIFAMLKDNIGPAFIVMLVSILASFAASLVGSLLCGVGIVFTAFYAQLVMAFLYGSLYNKAKTAVL
ncbi:MAG: DUF4013 domain-containing protein [Anaerolineae bacterium]|nr:DUF4013 domain-containing protein [Anaerolineae bacterium]